MFPNFRFRIYNESFSPCMIPTNLEVTETSVTNHFWISPALPRGAIRWLVLTINFKCEMASSTITENSAINLSQHNCRNLSTCSLYKLLAYVIHSQFLQSVEKESSYSQTDLHNWNKTKSLKSCKLSWLATEVNWYP